MKRPLPLRTKSVADIGSLMSEQITEEPREYDGRFSLSQENEQIERAAAGGHSGEDDKQPLLAQWQLDYSPTV